MNWKRVIEELGACGMSQSAIAIAIGVEQSAISRLATGGQKSIAYEKGAALQRLHEQRRGRRRK